MDAPIQEDFRGGTFVCCEWIFIYYHNIDEIVSIFGNINESFDE